MQLRLSIQSLEDFELLLRYILLRLSDWVPSVRSLAEHILKNTLTADNIEVFIDKDYLVNKLQNVLRVDLKNTGLEIVDYLKDSKTVLKSSKMPMVLFIMKHKLESANLDIQLFALNAISWYGGWYTLEGILFAISSWQNPGLDKAKNLLVKWLSGSTRLYSKPDGVTRGKISEFFETVHSNVLISDKAYRESSFIIDTRR